MCPVSAERNRRDPKRISFADLRKYLRMALRNHRGAVLTDANGRELTKGCTIDDAMFGAGIATGTVPLDHGDGVNVERDDPLAGSGCGWQARKP